MERKQKRDFSLRTANYYPCWSEEEGSYIRKVLSREDEQGNADDFLNGA